MLGSKFGNYLTTLHKVSDFKILVPQNIRYITYTAYTMRMHTYSIWPDIRVVATIVMCVWIDSVALVLTAAMVVHQTCRVVKSIYDSQKLYTNKHRTYVYMDHIYVNMDRINHIYGPCKPYTPYIHINRLRNPN